MTRWIRLSALAIALSSGAALAQEPMPLAGADYYAGDNVPLDGNCPDGMTGAHGAGLHRQGAGGYGLFGHLAYPAHWGLAYAVGPHINNMSMTPELAERANAEAQRAAALAAMQSADALVNVGNATRYQLPSKVVEYAATGKPVVNIVAGDDDSSAAFFRRYPATWNVRTDSRVPLAEQGRDAARFLLAPPTCSRAQLDELLAPFRLAPIVRCYEQLLSTSPVVSDKSGDLATRRFHPSSTSSPGKSLSARGTTAPAASPSSVHFR